MQTLQQGLLITGIGMGLVFAVIIFLWGLMALLMRITSRKKRPTEEEKNAVMTKKTGTEKFTTAENKQKLVAAAVAVQFVIDQNKTGQQKTGFSNRLGKASSWQTVHRIRQLGNRN